MIFPGSCTARGARPCDRPLAQARDPQRPGQQHPAGMGHDSPAVAGHGDLGSEGSSMHLESAFRTGTDRTLDKPYSPSSRALFSYKRSSPANPRRNHEVRTLPWSGHCLPVPQLLENRPKGTGGAPKRSAHALTVTQPEDSRSRSQVNARSTGGPWEVHRAGMGDGQATGDIEHPELFDPDHSACHRPLYPVRGAPAHMANPYQYPDAPPGRGPVKTRTTSGSALPTLKAGPEVILNLQWWLDWGRHERFGSGWARRRPATAADPPAVYSWVMGGAIAGWSRHCTARE